MNTKLLDIKDIGHYWDYLGEAAQALREGELVAFPTETVYGLGANAQSKEAVARLYEVKQRPQEKELARLISDIEELGPLLEGLPVAARILMREFWPGPLTIVIRDPDGRDVGIRLPDHKVARDLIRMAGVPILATSANLSGRPPAIDAQGVMESFSGKVKILLDGGPSSLKVPSTVVKVTHEACPSVAPKELWRACHILRLGAIPKERIFDCLKKEEIEVVK